MAKLTKPSAHTGNTPVQPIKQSDFPAITHCPPGKRGKVKMLRKPSARTHSPPATYKRPRPDASAMPRAVWFAIICDGNCERKAMLALEDAPGVLSYLPVTSQYKRVGGRRKVKMVVERPLYPRYLFAALANGAGVDAFPFEAVRKIAGVAGFVSCDGTPMAIPHQVIARLMDSEREGEYDRTKKGRKRTLDDVGLQEGQGVRIGGDGPFKGFEAVVRSLMRGTHARVFMTIFGRPTETELPLDDLQAVESAAAA